MASPCAFAVGGGEWEAIFDQFFLSEARRLGRLAVVTSLVALATWSAMGIGGAASFSSTNGGPRTGAATVSIDGLAGNLPAAATVGETLRAAGVARGETDRLSASADAPIVAGQRIVLDRGLPVTLVVGGQVLAGRAPRGTVDDLLAAAGITLGPLDRVDPPLGASLAPGAIVRVTRVAERDETVQEAIPFPVQVIPDGTLDRGRSVVVTPGVPGLAVNSYHVQVVDGSDALRTLFATVVLSPVTEEVRRVGTRLPPAPADIEAIIRAAAGAEGADPDQLLRVAWCESRYNPSAVNPSGAAGLFQFMPGTWAANSVRAGYAGASVFDPVASANVAAWMFARGAAGQWACR